MNYVVLLKYLMFCFILLAEVNLSVERPLKVNLSTAKLDQVIEFWNTLSSGILPKETKAKRNGKLIYCKYIVIIISINVVTVCKICACIFYV